MKILKTFSIIFLMLFIAFPVKAQEKEAIIELAFVKSDSLNICKVTVTSDGQPAPDVSVKVYVKRLFGLLPIGDDITTDENGKGEVEFPSDLPGDQNKVLEVVAKIEEDDNFGTLEKEAKINWGLVKKPAENMHKRSLAGSRENAPVYFIVISNLLIFGIWGTLGYVVMQVFKIRKLGREIRKTKSNI